MTRTALYRVKSSDGRLLYVGQSHNPLSRACEHARLKVWSLDIATIDVVWFADRKSAEQAEREAIRTEKPEWNVKLAENPKRARGAFNPKANPLDRATWEDVDWKRKTFGASVSP